MNNNPAPVGAVAGAGPGLPFSDGAIECRGTEGGAQ